MELRHFRYFLAVAEEQSFTRAARRLHVSQSPLSRQLKDLEEELGVALFAARGRGIALTPAGEHFLIRVRALMLEVSAAVAAGL